MKYCYFDLHSVQLKLYLRLLQSEFDRPFGELTSRDQLIRDELKIQHR